MNKQILKSVVFSFAVVGAVAFASNVTLPNAFTAGTPARAAEVNANFAAVKTAVDDNHARITALATVPPITAPTFNTGWQNVGGGWQTAGYFKDAAGLVHVRGLVVRTMSTAVGPIFQLPAGYRPTASLQFPSRCGNDVLCYVAIDPYGDVTFGGPGDPGVSLTLDGIVFDLR